MADAADAGLILSKRKAISVLFPHAIFLERGGRQEMFDAIIRTTRASNSPKFMWIYVKPYINSLFDKSSHSTLNRVITLISPYVPWDGEIYDKDAVVRWAAATLEMQYTEQIGQSAVNALLQVARIDRLRPHISIGMWAWLKKQPPLPPLCRGRYVGTTGPVVLHIRGLEDVEILKSYLLLVWSEWEFLYRSGIDEMVISIREDFGGMDVAPPRGSDGTVGLRSEEVRSGVGILQTA